ncbi:MAG: CbiX/SirB N-terminal domain-containing protein [Chromatiales bacterium]|nr:CbiX/SirB N-terminal domain-containing protein [Chromatiales bacterium]
MNALLLIAHGSRREASNQEVRELAKKLAQVAGDRYGMVEAAFLELADPSIPDGVSHCVSAGATQVTAVPYFLSAGRHVAEDIPHELEVAAGRHPNVQIEQSAYLGQHGAIADLLLGLASKAGETTLTERS